MDYSPPGSSVHRISQARILEWVAIAFSRGSSNPGTEPMSPAWQVDSLPLSHLGISKCKIEKCYSLFSYENTEIHHFFLKSGREWLGLVISIKPKTYWCQYLQFKNTGVGCHFFLQSIFLTQWWNPHVLHCRWIFFCWVRDLSGKPEIFQFYDLLRNSFLLSWLSVLFSMLLISALIIFFHFYCLICNSDTDLLLVSAFCLIWQMHLKM